MKNLEISRNFATGLENIVDRDSYSGSFGVVGSSVNQFSRPVYAPYFNFQIGTLEKSYCGQEFFKANYEPGSGTPVIRKY